MDTAAPARRPIRVVQWFTGEIACHQIRAISATPWLELAGAVVHHPEKEGLDVGDIAGIEPLGLPTVRGLEAGLAIDADLALFNPPMETYDEIVPILAAGRDVISIMSGWRPHERSVFPDLVAACEAGSSSLYGTGLNPGLSYELALLASSVSVDIESVRIVTCEPQETLSPIFLEMFGFGRSEEELSSGPAGVYRVFARTLHQVTDLICEEIGLAHDGHDFSYTFEPAVAAYDGKIRVDVGTMAGLALTASTTRAGEPVASIEVRFLLGADYVRPEWLDGGPSDGWIEAVVDGTPVSRVTHAIDEVSGFVSAWATGTRALNAVPAVVAAPPGVLSPADLPLSHALPGLTLG